MRPRLTLIDSRRHVAWAAHFEIGAEIMAKSALKLASPPPPPRAPERERLAAAQARIAAATARVAEVAAAQERRQEASSAANHAVETAEAAVETARQNEGKRLVSRFLQDDAATSIPSLEDATAALTAAKAEQEKLWEA